MIPDSVLEGWEELAEHPDKAAESKELMCRSSLHVGTVAQVHNSE
jgi:hypothetical protein